MFTDKRFWQLHIARQTSAAKGNMGACPQMRMNRPD
jgi:hypothetical protein